MTMSFSEITPTWPATIAGSDERRELHHTDCEAVAARMDRLYKDAPLEANERAALIFLYSAKLVIEDLKLRTHRVKNADLISVTAVSNPWNNIVPKPNQSPVSLTITRARKIAGYVRYLELRYFESGSLPAHMATIAPITSSQYDDIVFCAETGQEILPRQPQGFPVAEGDADPVLNCDPKSDDSYPFKLGFTFAEHDASMERYILAKRAHFASGGTLDEWTDLENCAVLARIENSLPFDTDEPEPL